MKNRPVSVVPESQVGEGDNLEQPDKITVITFTASIYYQVQCSSGEHCICFGPILAMEEKLNIKLKWNDI